MMGTLIRNTEPHQKCSSKAPPSNGPTAAPPEAIAAQMPMASASSRGSWNVTRMMAMVAGSMAAPPIASSTRAPINTAEVVARAASMEATPKTTMPAMKMRRCPMRSPSAPSTGISPAMTRE